MNNELIGIIEGVGQLVGSINDKGLTVEVQIAATGPQGVPGEPGEPGPPGEVGPPGEQGIPGTVENASAIVVGGFRLVYNTELGTLDFEVVT